MGQRPCEFINPFSGLETGFLYMVGVPEFLARCLALDRRGGGMFFGIRPEGQGEKTVLLV